MIEVNQPFHDISPLVEYLVPLERVTSDPTNQQALAELALQDANLTSRAVLFPETKYVHGEGYRVFGYRPCTASDGVLHLAQFHQPGAEVPAGQQLLATDEVLRSQSRGALITLGAHIAVSGAFYERDIPDAYEAIKESMSVIGEDEPDPQEFSQFGLKRIGRDLLTNYVKLYTHSRYEFPIGKKEAKGNIEAAWQVVGRPFGVWTKAVAHIRGGRF
jgi:hypothetical protein